MANDEEAGYGVVLLRYGVALLVLALYAVVLVGGFLLAIRAAGWVDAKVLQPLVGGGDLLSAALLGAVTLAYAMVVYRLTTSGAFLGSESGSSQSSLRDFDWGRF